MRLDVTLTAGGRTIPLEWIGPRGPLTWSWDTGGPESCSWEMLTSARLDERMSHALVRILHLGMPLWTGRLSAPDPGAGSFAATGLRAEVAREPALDSSGDSTAVPNVAVDQGTARGLAAGRYEDLGSAEAFDLDDSDTPTIGTVLDAQAELESRWWQVVPWRGTSPGLVTYASPEVGPRYVLPMPTDGAVSTLDDEDYVTRVLVNYVDVSTSARARVEAVDTAAEALLGAPRTRVVDLTGSTARIDSTSAAARAQGILARLAVRSAWTAPLEPDVLTAVGGAPAPWAFPFQVVRLLSRTGSYDMTIGRTVMSEDAAPRLEPLGMAARDLSAVIADLTEGVAA